ncbi:MAG: response regulator [Opitutae bacterium]|nr:response regulator [Opitutae bacterium]
MNILVADDHPTNRKLLRAQLEAKGFGVTEAADGVEALQILADGSFDAVISDILMPRMDGYRFCHEVRRSAAWSSLPFILYSSTYNSPADVKLSSTVGANQFIAKPAPVDALVGALQLAIGRRASRSSELPGETTVLKQYSAVLVAKLEEKNRELQETLEVLQRAHDRIAGLNAELERRVAERTAELSAANTVLQRALDEVKQLSGLIPICAGCKKIRDEKDYWLSVEAYLSAHTHAKFSHGLCPDCYARQVADINRLLNGPPPAMSS